ncbi:MAG: amidohydrolase family protein [Caulobacteraceae bacterium]
MAWTFAAGAMAGDYTVLTTGRPSGQMTVTGDAAHRQVAYSYNDRGRGPDIKADIGLTPDGRPAAYTISGVDYLKASAEESFSIRGGKAVWSSQADQGEGDASGAYLPYLPTPEDFAILARALLKAPHGELDLLPSGHARIEKVLDQSVQGATGRKTVTLYAISGVGLTPWPVWLDGNAEMFFSGSTWNGTVAKGWEAAAPGLIKVQEAWAQDHARQAAKLLTHHPKDRRLVIRNANVFDAKTRTMRPGSTVTIEGDRIGHVWFGEEAAIPAGVEVIDAKGKALLPGLWDMHVHISSDDEGPLQLAAGVTSVRDMANDIDELTARKAHFDSGELVGPRIFRAGIIDGKGALAAPTKVLADTPEEVRAAVNRYADLGYEQIKLYSALKPELVPVATEAAHARGLRVSGHIPQGMLAGEAVAAGYDEMQHINFVFLNFFGHEVAAKTASPVRFTAVGEKGSALDLQSPEVRAFIAELKRKDIVIDPTLATFEDMFTGAPRVLSPSLGVVKDRLPPAIGRTLYGGSIAKTDADRALYRASYANMIRMVGELHKAGVRLVPGTDGFDGFLLHREFELWAKAGISNTDILYAATLGAASVNHHDKELGSIESGKLADLVLIDGDPSKNISDIRKTSLVIKDGAVFDPKALYAEVGIR